MSTADFVIVREHPNLVSYVDLLQRKNAESLSFYPLSVFEREAERRRVWLGLLNSEPCGYIYMGAVGTDVRCHQVCVQYDARRKLYGASLVAAVEEYAERAGARSMTLRCGFDLEANAFWPSLSYRCIDTVPGGVRRMRQINVWRKYLQPPLFAGPSISPSKGKTDASIWRKRSSNQSQSRFARGKRLIDYRESLLEDGEAKPRECWR